jgi:hypothetical protein
LAISLSYITLINGCVRARQGKLASSKAARSAHALTRRQTLMFSATWPPEVQRVANLFTEPSCASVVRVTTQGTCGAKEAAKGRFAVNENIQQRVVMVAVRPPAQPPSPAKLLHGRRADPQHEATRWWTSWSTLHPCHQLARYSVIHPPPLV